MAEANHRTCTVYGLCKASDKEIRYVGQTTVDLDRRLREHIKRAKNKKSVTHRDYWIRAVLREGDRIVVVELEKNAAWNDSEISWIAKLKDSGANLVNGTAGGEGMLNAPIELKQRISDKVKELWKNPEYREKAAGSRKGVAWSDAQYNARMSIPKEVRSERARVARQKLAPERRSEISSNAAKVGWERRVANGTAFGVSVNSAKLNDEQVIDIRRRFSIGETRTSIAKNYGISTRNISKIVTFETWKHVL